MSPLGRRSLLAAGFAAALAVRLGLLLSFPGNYDTESYDLVASIAARGGDPYAETTRYNYSPVWAHVLVGMRSLAAATGIRPMILVGLLLLAGDIATAVLIYRMARARKGRLAPALAALAFFFNPVSILISSYHLQFDSLAILLLLASIALFERAKELPAAMALSASLLVKQVTALHPLLFRRRPGWRGLLPVALPYAAFVASFLPYAASSNRILEQVVMYRGLTAVYGFESLLVASGAPDWVPVLLFAAVVAYAIVRLGRVELTRACLFLYLVVLIFAPGFGRQYCVWPIALGALVSGPGFFLFSGVAGAYLVGEGLRPAGAMGLLPGWYGPWWAAIFWLAWEVRAGTARSASGGANAVKIPATRP